MLNKIRTIIIPAVALVFVLNAQSQSPSISWSIDSKKLEGSSYELYVSGTLPMEWHLYGTNENVEGLTPPILNFEYENVVVRETPFFQTGSQHFNDPIFDNNQVLIYKGNISFTQRIDITGTIPALLRGSLTFFIGNAEEFYPVDQAFSIPLEGGIQAESTSADIKLATINLENPVADCGDQFIEEKSLWGFLFLGFAGGLLALLTPCVFPMIPFTVSFFTNRSPNRKSAIKNGMVYGFFILLIYVLLSVPFHIIGNVDPEIFNTISTNAYLNILFFAIFIYFSLSFFGLFEITMPSSLTNKADQKSGLANLGSIFFMSITLALVSFSCTGPILGSLLVGSLSGGVWQLTFGLAGFGLALGLPFGLFAMFPNLLKSLPKSGGWLDTVKKVLAFVELALAFKFLSNADLVMHWGILKREVFIGIWLLITLGLSAYLFGLIRFKYDVKGQKISVGRKLLGVLTLLFSVYLIPGLTYAGGSNLNLLSGFPPPMSYSIYDMSQKAHGVTVEADVINDYQQALKLADSLNKPLLIDFTGWACVNCRKMEENVWNTPEISSYIKENYVLVSLYVDDRRKLPVEERITYTTKDKKEKSIITHGDKWATFEAENFGQVSQPFYAVLNKEEILLNNPIGYTPDVNEYLDWLTCAKNAFDR